MEKVYRVLGKRGRVTIPWEIRRRVGFGHNDIVSFAEAPDGQSVIVKKEWICDDCEWRMRLHGSEVMKNKCPGKNRSDGD